MFSSLKDKLKQKFSKSDSSSSSTTTTNNNNTNASSSAPPTASPSVASSAAPAQKKPSTLDHLTPTRASAASAANTNDGVIDVYAANGGAPAEAAMPGDSEAQEQQGTQVAPLHPALVRDLQRYYFGADYKAVNYATTFLQDRYVSQYPSSVFSLAACFPPIAHTLMVVNERDRKNHYVLLQQLNGDKKNDAVDGDGVANTTTDAQGYVVAPTTNSEFAFISANAEAFTVAAENGQSAAFLKGANLGQLLGLQNQNGLVSSPIMSGTTTAFYINSVQNSAYTNQNTNGCGAVGGFGVPLLSPLSVTSSTGAVAGGSPLAGWGHTLGMPIMTTSSVPKDPFWLYQTAFHDVSPNIALGRLQPQAPRCTLTPAQFAALQQQMPLNSQRKRWRQVYNSRDHGFNMNLVRKLCQDQIKYGDKPCVLVMSVQTPDQINSELGGAIQLASLPAPAAPSLDENGAACKEAPPQYRPPTVVGTYFTVAPFRDGYVKKYFGQEGTFVFRSLFASEEKELEDEALRVAEADQLRSEAKEQQQQAGHTRRVRKGRTESVLSSSSATAAHGESTTTTTESCSASPPRCGGASASPIDFTTRVRGLSFASAPQMVPPPRRAPTNTANKTEVNCTSGSGPTATQPHHTPQSIVRDCTEAPLSDTDYCLKFFKIPPREDGPEVDTLLNHFSSPNSSAFAAMTRLVRDRLVDVVAVCAQQGGEAWDDAGHKLAGAGSALSPSADASRAAPDAVLTSYLSTARTKKKTSSGAPSFLLTDAILADLFSLNQQLMTPQAFAHAIAAPFVAAGVASPSSPSTATEWLKAIATKVVSVKLAAAVEEARKAKREELEEEEAEEAAQSKAAGAAPTEGSGDGNPSPQQRREAPQLPSLADEELDEILNSITYDIISHHLAHFFFPPFKCLAIRSNDYFIRYTEQQLFVGGGGEGPALMLTEDLAKATSSPQSDTFGTRRSVKAAKAEDDAMARRLALLLTIMSRITELDVAAAANSTSAENTSFIASLEKKLLRTPSLNTSGDGEEEAESDGHQMIPASEAEMAALTRVVHYYATSLQQRRCRNVSYYDDAALFNKGKETAGHRRNLLMPTLLQAFKLQEEQQRELVENDKMRQVKKQIEKARASADDVAQGVVEEEEGASNTTEASPSNKRSDPASPLSPFASSESAAAAGFSFTSRTPSAILATTLNTDHDVSGPFSLPNLDAFFSMSFDAYKTVAERHFEEHVMVECGVAEAQIQTIELWEITEDCF